MIKPLRKYHFYLWRIIAIALPLVFILAVALRPASISKYEDIENDFAFSIKKLTNSSAQLTVELKSSLKAPSCLLYINVGSSDILLGKIDRKGSYHFEIPAGEKSIDIRLYDAIHKKDIAKTQVSYNHD